MPWIGGSVQQWVDELTTAVLDHYAAGAPAHTAARPDRAHPDGPIGLAYQAAATPKNSPTGPPCMPDL